MRSKEYKTGQSKRCVQPQKRGAKRRNGYAALIVVLTNFSQKVLAMSKSHIGAPHDVPFLHSFRLAVALKSTLSLCNDMDMRRG